MDHLLVPRLHDSVWNPFVQQSHINISTTAHLHDCNCEIEKHKQTTQIAISLKPCLRKQRSLVEFFFFFRLFFHYLYCTSSKNITHFFYIYPLNQWKHFSTVPLILPFFNPDTCFLKHTLIVQSFSLILNNFCVISFSTLNIMFKSFKFVICRAFSAIKQWVSWFLISSSLYKYSSPVKYKTRIWICVSPYSER